MSDLKPCPACGGEAHAGRGNLHHHWVECFNCLSTGARSTPDEAANLWNSFPRREEQPASEPPLGLLPGHWLYTTTSPDRERMRFEAALAAMTKLAWCNTSVLGVAVDAVQYADALLAELAKERP